MSEWHEGPCCGACFGDEEAGVGVAYDGYCCCYDENIGKPDRPGEFIARMRSVGLWPVVQYPRPEVTYGTYVAPTPWLSLAALLCDEPPTPYLSRQWMKTILEQAADLLEER